MQGFGVIRFGGKQGAPGNFVNKQVFGGIEHGSVRGESDSELLLWRYNAKRKHALAGSAPVVVGDGMMLVLMWLRGLVQLLMDIKVRIITNGGSMAMVAQIESLMVTTIPKYLPRTRNT